MNDDDERQLDAERSKSPAAAPRSQPEDRDAVAREIERETERAADAPITDSSSDDSRS